MELMNKVKIPNMFWNTFMSRSLKSFMLLQGMLYLGVLVFSKVFW